MNIQKVLMISTMFLWATASANEQLVFASAEDASVSDISARVLTEAYNKFGYDIRIQFLNSPKEIGTSNRGILDGELFRVEGINSKYSNLVQIPIAINYVEGFAFAIKDELKISDWESLRSYNLVAVKGVIFIEKNLSKRNIGASYVKNVSQAAKMLELGRADIIVMGKSVGLDAISRGNINNIKPIGDPLIRINVYHYLHKKHKDIALKLQAVLEEMEESGRIEEIRQKTLSERNF